MDNHASTILHRAQCERRDFRASGIRKQDFIAAAKRVYE
jgi:hypothetical protein